MTPDDLRDYVGQSLKFTFANGVSLYARIDETWPDTGPVLAIRCGPSDLVGPEREEIAHPDSLWIVPSAIASVREVWKRTDPRIAAGERPSQHAFEEPER